jgi:parallel beta-helix repeat protein
VRLIGDYIADVPLKLPSYTRLVLEGSLVAASMLNADSDTGIQGQLGTGMIYANDAAMVGVEGGRYDCTGWKSNRSMPRNGTSTLAGIVFNSVLGGWMRNVSISRCGCGSSGGPRPGYVSGNIWVRGGWGNAIESVDATYSCNRGVWAETEKLMVWNGNFSYNKADGIDFDAGTTNSLAFNNTCSYNSRHGVFIEEGASGNTVVGNTLIFNRIAGVDEGSAFVDKISHDNVVLGNTLYGAGQTSGIGLSVGGGSFHKETRDFIALGNELNGGPSRTHGAVVRGIFSLNTHWGGDNFDTGAFANSSFFFYNV